MTQPRLRGFPNTRRRPVYGLAQNGRKHDDTNTRRYKLVNFAMSHLQYMIFGDDKFLNADALNLELAEAHPHELVENEFHLGS